MTEAQYSDLEDYGIVGNLKTSALIGKNGSVDWLCLPFTESPSVFAGILDAERGGWYSIRPVGKYASQQRYLEHTNVLQTTFTTALGAVRITDFMPVPDVRQNQINSLYRKVECLQHHALLALDFRPRFNYAATMPEFRRIPEGVEAVTDDERLVLCTPVPLEVDVAGVTAEFRLRAGETSWFILSYGNDPVTTASDGQALLEAVAAYWRKWLKSSEAIQASFQNEVWQDVIIRSSLVLKLLTSPFSGAISAAPTTSLPECIAGVRNWDYRFSWVRDTSFTVQALYHLGHLAEARSFKKWIESVIETQHEYTHIQVLYKSDQRSSIHEKNIDHLSGYKNSTPVRIGNAASNQKQMDIYGELVGAIYETTRYGNDVDIKDWEKLQKLIGLAAEEWSQPDSGIWEMRNQPRHYVYSKLMCWLALDRGMRIAGKHGFKAPLEYWSKVRNQIRDDVLENGFSTRLNSFVQYYGSEELDASNLLICTMDFLPLDDRRILGTISAVENNLMTEDGLVYRYLNEDRLAGNEGTFTVCSFWLVKALVLTDRLIDAQRLFLKLLRKVSPLGLLSEEIEPDSGRQIGNFPQAFSHIGLINAALYIGRAKGKHGEKPAPMGMNPLQDAQA